MAAVFVSHWNVDVRTDLRSHQPVWADAAVIAVVCSCDLSDPAEFLQSVSSGLGQPPAIGRRCRSR